MKTISYLYVIAALLFHACQSAPAAVEAPIPAAEVLTPPIAATVPPSLAPVGAPTEPSTVSVDARGFSPRAQFPANRLELTLHFGSPERVSSWVVEILDATGNAVKSFRGVAPDLPPSLSWDGTGNASDLLVDGVYLSRLTVTFTDGSPPSVQESPSFVLDVTPPSGSLSVQPQPFVTAPAGEVLDPPLVSIQVQVQGGGAQVATWRLGVIHPDGRRFIDFISEDHRDGKVVWNGKALGNNSTLEPGVSYNLEMQVFDIYGNKGIVSGTLVVGQTPPALADTPFPPEGTLATVTLDRHVLAQTTLYFPPFSSSLSEAEPVMSQTNSEALQTLAEALLPLKGAKIRIVGHANKVYWQDPVLGEIEQSTILVPLSLARARAVQEALGRIGVDVDSFDIEGVGAEGAVADFGDHGNTWKNRRVEFVVEG